MKKPDENQQHNGSGLESSDCSPLLEGDAVTELLENMEAWADEKRRQSHPATLTMLRAIRTIEDLQAAGGRADHTRFNAKGPMSEKQPRSRKFSTENDES